MGVSSICDSFVSIFVGFLVVVLVSDVDVNATSLNSGFNHRAHAVPNGPYHTPDLQGNGWATIELDGSLSHSHYFNPTTGVLGRIVSYSWSMHNKVVCRKQKCTLNFPLGVSRIVLAVVDNTGDYNAASTAVTVYRATRPEVRVWIYKVGWAASQWRDSPLPVYSFSTPNVRFHNRNSFPNFVRDKPFSARVLGVLNFPKTGFYAFRVFCGGAHCLLRVGGVVILSNTGPVLESKFKKYRGGSQSTSTIELLYRRTHSSGAEPMLELQWKTPIHKKWATIERKHLSHIPQAYYPVLNSVSPPNARIGDTIELQGSSFLDVKAVYIGLSQCLGVQQNNQFTIRCILPGGRGRVKVRVLTSAGYSNELLYEVGPHMDPKQEAEFLKREGVGPLGYYQSIRFKTAYMRFRNGSIWHPGQLTAITIGPDLRYYIGSLDGHIHAVETNREFVIRNHCRSANVGQERSVLGVAFNPADVDVFRLYASTSIPFWLSKNVMDFEKGWHNGEVIEMRRSNSHCLRQIRTVVSGLPVSNHDHAVNGISFDQHGAMLVTVAGTTNAGVSGPNVLGGISDSPLSGAMLRVPIFRANFNGHVKYSQYSDPATARKTAGHVEVYASGLRNSFCHVVHSKGKIYATDNGSNMNFGPRSTGCNSQGGAHNEKDSLFMLKKGSYCGYANRNRGRFDKKQCVFRPREYNKPLTQFESSTTGLIEYTANTFGAQMRGDLIATKYAVNGNGRSYWVRLSRDGQVSDNTVLADHSGLTAVLSPTGAIVMPRVFRNHVTMLVPVESNPGRLVVTSVFPFRGPRRGGNRVTITGWNLHPPLTLKMGGRFCTKVREYKNGRSLTCIAPKGKGKVPVVVRRHGVSSKSHGYEYWYMKV